MAVKMMPNMNNPIIVDRSGREIEQDMIRNAITQIAALEADVEKFKAHSIELNRVYWRLAVALGYVVAGDGKINLDTEELMTEVEKYLEWAEL